MKTVLAPITPEHASEGAKGTPTDLANESHAVAVASVYADAPAVGRMGEGAGITL
jgi:hypothetical protein